MSYNRWPREKKPLQHEDMCSYSERLFLLPGHPDINTRPDEITENFFNRSNKRVKCPVCGRKMWAARRQCDDGCCLYYQIPPHKKKGHWKKPKKVGRGKDAHSRRNKIRL